MGNINSVFFNPEELKLIKESPEDRRRFIDISISQMNRGYFYALQKYKKILGERNNLLKTPDKEVVYETCSHYIRQLKKFITPETELLDVGTGSGILAILSLMFGAKHAVGTDLDICAIDAVADNCANNGIAPEQFEMMIGNIITDKEIQDKVGYECYDIVVANILADVLVPLTPVIINQLKPGGIYITSGIIDDKEQTVVDAVKAAGLELVEVTYQGEWVSVTAMKPAV